jgi:hypothetical protein
MQLAPGIHFAPVGDRSIVMNLREDRYVGIGPKLTKQVLDAIAHGAGAFGDSGRIAELEALGSRLVQSQKAMAAARATADW